MDYFGVISRKIENSAFNVEFFYEFEEACGFAENLCNSGYFDSVVVKVLREYFDDMPMSEFN